MAFSVCGARRVSRGTDDETVFRTRYVKCSGAAAAERTHSVRPAGGREGELDFGRQSHPMAMIRTDKEMEKGEENECTLHSRRSMRSTWRVTSIAAADGQIGWGRGGEGESVQSMTATRDTHESMHALVDKVPIAILLVHHKVGLHLHFWTVVDKCPLSFLHLGADCVGNTTRKKERCPQASGPK